MEFKTKESLIHELSSNEQIEFGKRGKKNQPLPLTDEEYENFHMLIDHTAGPSQTSMRMDDLVLWKFELIKRTSKVFFNNELNSMPIIINALFDTYFYSQIQVKDRKVQHNLCLEKCLRKLNKAYFYNGKIGEFSVIAYSYNRCYVIRLLNLVFLEESLLTDFERDLLIFILKNQRFNISPVNENLNDLSLKEIVLKSDLDFREIVFCFGKNSYQRDLTDMINNKQENINPEIPSNEADLSKEENSIYARKYLEDKDGAKKWLTNILPKKVQAYKESIFVEPIAYGFYLLKSVHTKTGDLVFKK